MNHALKTLAIVAIATFTALPAAANTFLGARVVADNSETDVINVPGNGLFRDVRFCVVNRAVHFRDVDVRFANGGNQDLPVRALIGPGGCTNWLNLRGPVRNIASIVLNYDTLINAGSQAVVTAHGR